MQTVFASLLLVSALVHARELRQERATGSRHMLKEGAAELSAINFYQGALAPANSSASGGGCLLFPGFYMPGQELLASAANLQPTFDQCCASCGSQPDCTAFTFCRAEGGCEYGNYSSPFRGCQLVRQNWSVPVIGGPPMGYLISALSAAITGGSPVRFVAPKVAGYTLYQGLSLSTDYGCSELIDSLDISNQSCSFEGTPLELAPRCGSDPRCKGFAFFPLGRLLSGFPIVTFKGGQNVSALNTSLASFNQNSALFVREEVDSPPGSGPGSDSTSSGGGGLSGGAVAGIAVGACCGMALVVAGVGYMMQRRRQRLKGRASEQIEATVGFQGEMLPTQSNLPSSLRPTYPSSNPSSLRPTNPSSNPSSRGRIHPGSFAWDLSPASAASRPPSEHLLSRLGPEEDWRACAVDYHSIEFCKDGDGSFAELGQGAFSKVYRVLLDGVQPYAAKVLHVGTDPRRQEMFLKEASLLRKIRHRNCAGFGGVCVYEEMGILLMELCEGLDLHTRMQTVNKAGQRLFGWYIRGKTVALDIARALHYLHSLNLTHFDVKANNVLLSRDLTGKLADYGFTKMLRHTHHTFSHNTPGTFDYMAPELLMGKQCTQMVDVWSFGVLLWAICTGEYPTRGALRELHVPEECPQEVTDLIGECMDHEPDKRPTAKELVQRLAQLQQHRRDRGPAGLPSQD